LTSQHKKSSLAALTLAAVGIVYGDIGTSPLYTLKTIFDPVHGLALTTPNLLGIVSLIFWGLTMIVSLKYVTLVLRADNRGEGGIMALMALALNSVTRTSRWHYGLMVLGVFGATMFYGDSVITPAISVLGAIEGLEVATPGLEKYVVPLTIVVLVGLYSVQRHGTAGIGRWFGPIMVVWFAVLAVMGVINIAQAPVILKALNPLNRRIGLLRAIQQSGFRCRGGVLTGAYQQQYQNLSMWVALCGDGKNYAVFIAPTDDIQVRDCTEHAQLNLPLCRRDG